MSKFKVGDRVAVYDSQYATRTLGKVTVTDPHEEYIWVQLLTKNRDGSHDKFHPKQLRKLKPKAKVKGWILHMDYSKTVVFSGVEEGNPISCERSDKLVFVKEVFPGEITITREDLAQAFATSSEWFLGSNPGEFMVSMRKALGFKEYK